jgi:hypothetical protein
MNLEIPTELPPMPEPPDLKKYLSIVIVAFAINALIILALVLAFGAMAAAKCLFIEIAVGTGLLFIAIFFFHVDISNLLQALEMLAEEGRDETVVQMRHGRAQLRQISQKLEYTIHPPEHENAMHDLMQHAMPLVQILISKEKNWMQLGLFGWRLAKDAMRVMKQTRNI